jgi:hypothetical protein
MLPFTTEQFFSVFAAYNQAVWPAPVIAYALIAIATLTALGAWRHASTVGCATLGALWIWTGIAYHWLHFAAINPIAPAFGAAFVAQGALLVGAGATGRGLPRAAPVPARQRLIGLGLIFYAALLYPLLGRLAGHVWPAVPSFGITPCPLTIATIGVLLLLPVRVHPVLLIVPLAWTVIGGSAAILLTVPQDWALPVAGVVGAAVLFRQRAPGPRALPEPPPV